MNKLTSLLILSLALTSCQQKKAQNTNNVTSTETAAQSSNETTIGFKQEMNRQVDLHQGKTRTGQEVYELTCRGCHGKNTQGAPLPGDKNDWNRRMQQGFDQLILHTQNGYGDYMPAKGGCRDCLPEELSSAIKYMVELPEIRYDLPIDE